jgi:glycosyltransferase 2 family protein
MRSLAVPRTSYFVETAGLPRVRRPRDILTAVIGLLLVIWAVLAIDRVPSWEQAFTELVLTGPPWVHTLLGIGYSLSLIYALVLVGALVAGGAERRPALRDVTIVAVGATGLVLILSLAINGAWPYVLPEIDLENPVPQFPVLRVAVVTAMLVVAGPHVTRPLRRFGWLAMLITTIAAIGLNYGSPSHTIGSFGVGLFSAGLLLAIAGSPRGYPNPDTVSAALTHLGVSNRGLEAAPYQTWGVVRFVATGDDGEPVDVKVHGRDAFDSQLAAKMWHTLWYRETGPAVSYSRLQAVEHEALMTVMADRAGVTVPRLVAVGSASSEIALIAFGASGVALPEIDPDRLTDDLLVRAWSQIRLLHEASMSHGSLRTSAMHVGPDGPIITDFALGSLAADEADQGSDVVELLYGLTILVGEERAVRTALEGLGRERLVAALPYLQLAAVSPNSRRLTEEPKDAMSALSSKATELTEADMPEPVKLRRVTTRSLIMTVLLLLITSALISAFTSVDYAEIWSVLQAANWALIGLALVVGHTQFFPQATATMFAVPAKLPFWPLLTLQTASQFISLAIPSAAGRVAMNAAFLIKFGVSTTVAVAQGAIDGFSGFLVQVAIMLVVLIGGDVDLNLDIDTSDVPWLLILGLATLAVIGVVLAVLRIEALNKRVVPVVSQAWGALMVVLRQPTRAIGLLGSNFVYWNVLGITLWLTLQAVGTDLSYGSALFVAAGTSLLAGFMPVPGGVGVAEATMTALLATFGVDESTAFAVTVTYRVITFYLPALEGFFGTRWLDQNEYI